MPTDPNATPPPRATPADAQAGPAKPPEPTLHLKIDGLTGDIAAVKVGQPVEFIVSWANLPAGHSETGSIFGEMGSRELRLFTIDKPTGETPVTGVLYLADHGKVYRAHIYKTELDDQVTVAPQEVAAPGGAKAIDGPDQAIEISPGQYDGVFAWWSGGAVFRLSILVLNEFWKRWPTVTMTPATVKDGHVLDTVADQGFVLLVMLCAAIACVILLVGAWLGALETRGRLTLRVPLGPTERDGSDPVTVAAAAIENADKILGRLTLMRGSIAVITAGIAILLMALASSCQVAISSHGAPPTSSPTTPAAATSSTSPGSSTAPSTPK